MKKIVLLFLCLCIILGIGFAKKASIKKKSNTKQKIFQKKNAGRECCTKEYYGPNGVVISLTACAGWLFSNGDAAYK